MGLTVKGPTVLGGGAKPLRFRLEVAKTPCRVEGEGIIEGLVVMKGCRPTTPKCLSPESSPTKMLIRSWVSHLFLSKFRSEALQPFSHESSRSLAPPTQAKVFRDKGFRVSLGLQGTLRTRHKSCFMIEGLVVEAASWAPGKVGVGKGLNVKGKSAKKNRLSAFVPWRAF